MKKLLLFWKKGPRPFRLAPSQIRQISESLKSMIGLMPFEFAQHPRGPDELTDGKL